VVCVLLLLRFGLVWDERVRAPVKAIYVAAPEEATGWNLCLGKFDEQNDALSCLACVVALLVTKPSNLYKIKYGCLRLAC